MVAVATGLVTGLLIPATLLAVGFGPERWEKEGLVVEQLPAMTFAMGIALTLALSLYASSIARNTMRAVGLTVLLGSAAVALVFAVAAPGLYWVSTRSSEMAQAFEAGASFDGAWLDGDRLRTWVNGASVDTWMLKTALAGCFLAGIQWALQACSNFQRCSTPFHLLRRQGFRLAAGLIVLTLVGVGVFGSLFLTRQAAMFAAMDRMNDRKLGETLHQLTYNGSLTPPVAEWLQVRPGSVDDAILRLVQRDGRRQAGMLGSRIREEVRWIESRLKTHLGVPTDPLPVEIRQSLGVEATSPSEAAVELVRRMGPTLARERVAQLPESRARSAEPRLNPGAVAPRPGNTISSELRRRYNLPEPPRP
jgi:hypothetical protein